MRPRIRYEERVGLRSMSRTSYRVRMLAEEPPARENWSDGEDSPLWLEWHRVRGIDPYAYKRRGYRLPARVRRAVIDRDGYVCGICGEEVDPPDVHIDHIHPRRLGGSDDLENLQVAHGFCNISKGARPWRTAA